MTALAAVFVLNSAVFAALAMAVAHYLVPRMTGQDVGPPWTYVIGAGLGITIPFVVWALLYRTFVAVHVDALWPAVVLACILSGAGVGTLICYHYDAYHGYRTAARHRERERVDA